jgi:opacity protein-like surface antigen
LILGEVLMKRSLACLPVVTLGLVALCVAPALAAPSGLGLGVHGGYGQSVDAESGSPLAGAHLVLNVTSWLGAVASVDFKFKEDLVENGIDYDVESYPITLMGRVYIPAGGFSPYVAGGFQYRIIKYGGNLFEDFEVDDSENAFGWVAGAGAEFNSSDSFGFFGEVLYEMSDPERDVENAVENAKDFKYDQWSVRAGITFFLN